MSHKSKRTLSGAPRDEGTLVRKRRKAEFELEKEDIDLVEWDRFLKGKHEVLLKKEENGVLNAMENSSVSMLEEWFFGQEELKRNKNNYKRSCNELEKESIDMTDWFRFLRDKKVSLLRKEQEGALDTKEIESLFVLEDWVPGQEGLKGNEISCKKRRRPVEEGSRGMNQKVNLSADREIIYKKRQKFLEEDRKYMKQNVDLPDDKEKIYSTSTLILSLEEKAPADLCDIEKTLDWFKIAKCHHYGKNLGAASFYVHPFEKKDVAEMYFERFKNLKHNNILTPLSFAEQENGTRAIVTFPNVSSSFGSYLRAYRKDLWLERARMSEAFFKNKLIQLYRSTVRTYAYVHALGFYVGRVDLENVYLVLSAKQNFNDAVLKLSLPGLLEQCENELQNGLVLTCEQLVAKQKEDWRWFQLFVKACVSVLDVAYFDRTGVLFTSIGRLVTRGLGTDPVRELLEAAALVTFEQKFLLFVILPKARFREQFHVGDQWEVIHGWYIIFMWVIINLKPQFNTYLGPNRYHNKLDEERPLDSKSDYMVLVRSTLFHFNELLLEIRRKFGGDVVGAMRQFELIYPSMTHDFIRFLRAQGYLGNLLYLA